MQATSNFSIKWDYQLDFVPDLIVEVTNVCDRACNGCYAANVFTNKSKEEIYEEMRTLFIDPNDFSEFCSTYQKTMKTLSLRGGEPSRHPKLNEIIEGAKMISEQVYLETHGRWILEDSSYDLLSTIQKHDVVVKISFDRMHGLRSSTLEKMCEVLKNYQIHYIIAITEESFSDFLFSRQLCYFEKDDAAFIFQKKVKTTSSLVKPRFGILNTKGFLVRNLNTKDSFKEAL